MREKKRREEERRGKKKKKKKRKERRENASEQHKGFWMRNGFDFVKKEGKSVWEVLKEKGGDGV